MKLLVSVRNAEEARAALRGGADVIDVKEPDNGPLGMAGAEAIAAVVDVVGEGLRAEGQGPRAKGRGPRAESQLKIPATGVDRREPPARMENPSTSSVPVSAALGEVLDWQVQSAVGALAEWSHCLRPVLCSRQSQQNPPLAKGGPGGGKHQTLDFVKLGPAGLADVTDWVRAWLETRRRLEAFLPGGCGWIAVAYADWQHARAPQPREILAAAANGGLRPCRGFLIDTFRKDGRGLFHWLTRAELRALADAARGAGLMVALAGSLSFDDVERLHAVGPDVVAVRGAVCRRGDRTSTVQEEQVSELAGRLSGVEKRGHGHRRLVN
jgi:uncharacterized protein (UPF0264 family)